MVIKTQTLAHATTHHPFTQHTDMLTLTMYITRKYPESKPIIYNLPITIPPLPH